MKSKDKKKRNVDMADWLVDLLTDPAAVVAKHEAEVAAERARRAASDASEVTVAEAAGAAAGASATGGKTDVPVTTDALATAWATFPANVANLASPPVAPPLALTTAWQRAQFGYAFAHSWFYHLVSRASARTSAGASAAVAFFRDCAHFVARLPCSVRPSLQWLLVLRQFVLMKRNPLYLRARVMTAVIMSLVLGGLYWQRTIDEGMTFYGTFLNT